MREAGRGRGRVGESYLSTPSTLSNLSLIKSGCHTSPISLKTAYIANNMPRLLQCYYGWCNAIRDEKNLACIIYFKKGNA